MLGRACQSDEAAQIGSAVGGNNRDAMQNFIRDRWISASQTYKDNVIGTAFAMVMGAGKEYLHRRTERSQGPLRH